MTETSDKILSAINEKKICPAPRWRFLLTNWVLWISFALVMGIGALSISLILDLILGHDWDLYPYLHKSFWEYVLFSLPYLWIVCLVIFAYIAYVNFTHLKGWYRHRVYKVITVGVVLSLVFGVIGFYAGIGSFIDEVFAQHLPYYRMLNGVNKQQVWEHPDEGLLGGVVTQILPNGEFELLDNDGNNWLVKGNTNFSTIVIGEKIKIIGKEKNEETFEAYEIRQWDPHEMRRTPMRAQIPASGICTQPEVPCH